MSPLLPTAPAPKRPGGHLFGWVFFIGLALMLFMLMTNQRRARDTSDIPLSEFVAMLEAGRVAAVTVHRDDLVGEFDGVEVPPATNRAGATAARQFRTTLPAGAGEDWRFIEWLLAHRNGAAVTVRNDTSYIVNILLPVVPWLLIFGFIWFFFFRQIRRVNAGTPPPAVPSPPTPT